MFFRASGRTLIRRGARFVATNPDVAGPRGRPSCGAFAAPIERITGKVPFYVGKPSSFMMRAALRHMKAGRLASLAYLIPVVAILLGWAILGETPPWLAAVGGALCLAGVYVARRP